MELSDSSKQPQETARQSEPCNTSEEVTGGLHAKKTSDVSCSPAPLSAAGGAIRAPEDPKEGPAASSDATAQECGRERLKRHREQMAGRVWIPERWGQEGLLEDWIDSSAFDEPLVPKGLRTAREALVEECRRRTNGRPQLQIDCSVGRS